MVRIKRVAILFFCTLLLSGAVQGATQDSTKLPDYEQAYNQLVGMLNVKNSDFKSAVFCVENAYYQGKLSYVEYNRDIRKLAALAFAYLRSNSFLYPALDSATVAKYAAVFKIMTDSIPIQNGDRIIYHQPYRYNFTDFDGSSYWPNMFITTLLETHKGNCHSMPYLYKIIMQELGGDAFLALAPNHIYIKLFSQKDGWYNTELTSGDFPIDAWIMASGYVYLNAIQNAVYMDTLGNTQCIAICLIDLAQGIEVQEKSATVDSFILKCCNTALTYFPNYINGLLLQSKIHERQFRRGIETGGYKTPQEYLNQDAAAQKQFDEMKLAACKIHDLGYRRMPLSMYIEWLSVLKTQRDKYSNKKISNFTK